MGSGVYEQYNPFASSATAGGATARGVSGIAARDDRLPPALTGSASRFRLQGERSPGDSTDADSNPRRPQISGRGQGKHIKAPIPWALNLCPENGDSALV